MELEQLLKDREIGDSVSRKTTNPTTGKNFSNIDELSNTARDLMNGDASDRLTGMRLARGVVQDLLQLCLYQEIEGNRLPGYMEFANRFDDGFIAEGNAKEYIFSNDLGMDTWKPEQFIPEKATKTNVDSYVIQMYDSSKTLNTKQAYQFMKAKTITESAWLPYFKSGKLANYIAILRDEVRRVYSYYKFDKIATKITSSTPAKTIKGTATNMFDCFVKEILPTIREMTTLNSKFNYTATNKNLQFANPKDLYLIANGDVIQQLQSGIKTQLFNAQLLDYGNVLNEMNIINLGNKITVGNGDTPISVSDTPYVDKNTIWIVHKDAIKHVLQIERSESQSFAMNMAIQLVLHVWGACDILPWGMIVKYTNNNLTTMPNE